MSNYTFTNVTEQGLNVTWISGSTTLHTLLGSGQVTTFTADSLTPETQSLVDAGYLVVGGTGSPATVSSVAAVPVILVGPYQATVRYTKGNVVESSSIYYIGLRTSTGATPASSPNDWKVFGGPSTGSLGSHVADLDNPHDVTAVQVGAIASAEKGAANGVASLDGSGDVPLAQIPSLVTEVSVASLLASQHTQNTDTVLDQGGGSQVTAAAIVAHHANSSNPHGVTAAQAGAIPLAQKAAASGVASLDSSTQVPVAQLSYAIAAVQTVADITARGALTPKKSDFVKVTDADGSGTTKSYIYNGSAWVEIVAAAPVASVNGQTGIVVLTTAHVAEGSNLYYTAGRVTAHTDVAANTAARHSQNTDTILDEGNPNEVTAAQLRSHLNNTSNPHGVTAAQVGAITQVSDDTSPTLGGALDAGGFVISNLVDTVGSTNAASQGFCNTKFLPKLAAYSTKAGSYTITSNDSAYIIRFTATGTATLPNGLTAGFQVVLANVGAGIVTIAADGTLNSKGNKLRTQYSAATATHIGGNVWEVFGDLTN